MRALLVFSALLATLAVAEAQPAALSPADSARAVAFLAAGDVAGLGAWLAGPPDRRAADGAADLVQLADRVGALQSEGRAFAARYAAERARLGETYAELFAGPRAAALFDRFVDQARTDPEAAIPLFESARYFQTRYAAEVGRRLDATLAEATEVFADGEGDAERARALLDGVRPYADSRNTSYVAVLRRIEGLSGRVNAVLDADARQDRFFADAERTDFRGGLSLGLGAQTRSATGPLGLELAGGQIQGPTLPLAGFGGGTTLAVGGEAYAFVSPAVAVGIGGSFSRDRYSTRASNEAVFLDLDVSSWSAYAFGRALLRTEVGLRPYVSVGGGLASVTRDAAEGSALDRVTVQGAETVVTRDFSTAGASHRGVQGRARVGVEYVRCATCALAVGGGVGLVVTAVDSDFAPAARLTAGIRAGLNF